MSGAPSQGWTWRSIPTEAGFGRFLEASVKWKLILLFFFFLVVDEMQTGGGRDGDVSV